MAKITASIVLYNTPISQLRRLFDSILRSSVSLTVYLVDNSPLPTDISEFQLPWVIYIRPDTNRGYGAGHNLALREALKTSEFHFIFNPDIYFESDELRKMIQFICQDLTIGQIMPKIMYPEGQLQYLCKLLPTPADLFLRRFLPSAFRKLVKKRLDRFELRFSNYDHVMDVPNLSGCFMLLRVSAIEKVGLFDERFFMYLEDFDLTRRINTGFRTVFFPGAIVVHDHARESYKSKRALLQHLLSAVKYFNKWGWIWDPQRSRVNDKTLRQLDISSKRADVSFGR